VAGRDGLGREGVGGLGVGGHQAADAVPLGDQRVEGGEALVAR
jgi:hypothetical protein